MDLILWGLSLIASFMAFHSDTPHYGSGRLYLTASGSRGPAFVASFSPDSQFIVGTSITDTVIYPDTRLHLWDLRTVDPLGPLSQPAPSASYDLSEYTGDGLWASQLAFSPDSRTLAILLRTEIVLLNIPDMTLQQTIQHPLDVIDFSAPIGTLAWAQDGHLLAAVNASGVMIWDVSEQKIIETREIDLDSYRLVLTPFETGWMVGGETSFMFCTFRLETCQQYSDPLLVVDAPRSRVVTGKTEATLWQQNQDGLFEPDTAYFASIEGTLESFSADGRYIFVSHFIPGDSGRSESTSWTLYEAETLSPLYEIESRPLWLAETEYFAVYGSLFHPASSQPVDVFDNESSNSDITITIEPHWSYLISVSSDGRWLLLELGGAGMVVPIID